MNAWFVIYAETSPQVHDAFVVVDCGGGTVVSLTTLISLLCHQIMLVPDRHTRNSDRFRILSHMRL